MAQSGLIGPKCKLYYNTGNFATPVWAVVPKVSDLMITAEADEADASSRESGAKLTLKTLQGLEVTFKMRKDPADAAFLIIDNAAVTYDILDFLVLDGLSTFNTARGYRFESQIFSHTESQNLGDVLYPEYKIKPAPTTNGPPSRAVVASGAPVFTAMAP